MEHRRNRGPALAAIFIERHGEGIDLTDTDVRSHMGRPRTGFIVALFVALAAWAFTGGESPTPMPRAVVAAPTAPPPIVDSLAPGQTLGGLWNEHGLDPAELPRVTEAGRVVFSWRRLRPGAKYEFHLGPDRTFRELRLTLDRDRRVVVYRTAGGFAARMDETPVVRKAREMDACIEGSAWQAVADAGEDPALTITMAEVLAAQIDFYTDLRSEDCFDVAFTVDERPDGSYRIVSLDAVRFETGDRSIEAYRFSADGERFDYYDDEGRSLRRMFLRSPLKFTRISSGFGPRMHPILRRVRHHNGVDYVAPTGTPVQAAGAGVVVRAGRNGGYGNQVAIRHGDRFVTSYSHLSRIAVRSGQRVSQGEVVGAVGSTGLSTAPHLHYRFMKDGKDVDPLATNLPTAVPLDGPDLVAFESHRDALRARLEAGDGLVAAPPGTPAAD